MKKYLIIRNYTPHVSRVPLILNIADLKKKNISLLSISRTCEVFLKVPLYSRLYNADTYHLSRGVEGGGGQ